ncbi:hypothetical protein D3C73_1448340 [compost metagenome]
MCIPVEGDWLRSVNPELLLVVATTALRGVIKNTIAAEYGIALSYWMRKSANRPVSDARLMVEVDEAFELAVELFAGLANQLGRYRHLDSLMTEVLAYDADDSSMIVRISDG